jgi:Ni,Fe-hydrogenase III small subunit
VNKKIDGKGTFDLLSLVMHHINQLFPWQKPLFAETSPAHAKRRSLFIRQVDCGSSNAAEQEILALFNPIYDAEQYGIHLVASPRQADLLLITGPITRNMVSALLATFYAMPEPRRVVTVGDDMDRNPIFWNSYAVVPLPAEICSVRLAHIPGDPPSPRKILEVLLNLDMPPGNLL